MKKKVLIILVIVILLGITTFAIDYNRLKNEKAPIFCISGGLYVDDVSVYRIGLGYSCMYIGNYEQLDGTIQNKNSMKVWFINHEINFQ